MKKILVRAPQWLGDAVVSTIFIQRLKLHKPKSHIHVLCPNYVAPLFESMKEVEGVIPLSYQKGGSIFTVGRQIKEGQFDEMYILPRSFRTTAEAFLGKVPIKIGFNGHLRPLFWTETHPFKKKKNYPLRYLSLINEHDVQDTTPFFPSEKLNRKEQEAIFGKEIAKLPRPILGISPLSVAPARTWSADRYIEVANWLTQQRRGSIVFLGGPSEEFQINAMMAKVKGPVFNISKNFPFPNKLKSFGWVMSQCDLFLGNDSGMMHVASALNIPSVVIFGSSDPKIALPLVKNMKPVQDRSVPCVPCARNECVRVGQFYLECMNAISTSDVIENLDALISKS